MIGRRHAQRSFFDVQGLPTRVRPDSFYGRMGALSDVLFNDDDLKEMYDPSNGRPSLPPSLMSGVLLLQFYDDVSDEEAVERTLFDLRWKVALDLPTDYAGFDSSSLSVFRKRLVDNGQERYAFDRLVRVGREAGFIPDTVTLLTDTVTAKGAGAVQDTYTLLRKSIRKLLQRCGFQTPSKRQGLSPQTQALLATYVDQNRKAPMDWSDPVQRIEQLKVLVQDAEAALELAAVQSDDREVRAAGWLLTKILGDDIVTNDHGQPQIGEGTAPERIISVTDPEMRHGRKSKASRFDGFKVAVTTEETTELIVDIADLPAPGSDGRELIPTLERVEAQAGVTVERVISDGAYGSGDNRARCATYPNHAVDLVAPLAQPQDPEVAKSAFQIDLAARTATCPQGQTTLGKPGRDRQGREILCFTFARSTCAPCPLFVRCVRSRATGRTVQTHAHEAYLQAARQRQLTEEFKTLYRLRSAIERKQAELVRHGVRATRYLGRGKRQLQRLWLAAVINLQRLFKLAEKIGVDLRAWLGQMSQPQVSWSAVR